MGISRKKRKQWHSVKAIKDGECHLRYTCRSGSSSEEPASSLPGVALDAPQTRGEHQPRHQDPVRRGARAGQAPRRGGAQPVRGEAPQGLQRRRVRGPGCRGTASSSASRLWTLEA
eukprot:scaffold4937_cov261-Pinguiococcus_pyrenoidosus.AAC.7